TKPYRGGIILWSTMTVLAGFASSYNELVITRITAATAARCRDRIGLCGWMRWAARPAIRRRTRASGWGSDQAYSWPRLLPQIEAWCANCPEPLICVMQQLLRHGDVD